MTNLEKVLSLHDMAGIQQQMVYEVWEDGEVTLTKGGDLYGRRNLHTIEYAYGMAWDKTLLPPANNNHSRIVCLDRESAYLARKIITTSKPESEYIE